MAGVIRKAEKQRRAGAASRPPTSEHRRRKQDRKRQEILDVAAAVFAELGFYTATMKDIADRLDMRPGSLYHYLESKELALAEICRDGAQAFIDRLAAISAKDMSCAEKVAAGIRTHLTGDRRDYVVNFAFSRRNLPNSMVGELNDLARAYRRLWVAIFTTGHRRGEWSGNVDPDTAADIVLSLCNSVATSLAHKDPAAASRTIDGTIDVFLSGLQRR